MSSEPVLPLPRPRGAIGHKLGDCDSISYEGSYDLRLGNISVHLSPMFAAAGSNSKDSHSCNMREHSINCPGDDNGRQAHV